MMLLNPVGLWAATACLAIIALRFFHAREQRREVSMLRLWEDLPSETHSRAARLRRQFDLLLLLQVAAALALALAYSGPARRTEVSDLGRLAIVIDGSASMRTLASSSTTRYDLARTRAEELLTEHPVAEAVLIQASTTPRILAEGTTPRDETRRALAQSLPTWSGDADATEILALLSSSGSLRDFERTVFLTDHALPDLPTSIEQIVYQEGANLAIESFSVRGNPNGPGVMAFVSVSNHTPDPATPTVSVSDGTTDISVQLELPAGERRSVVIPLEDARRAAFAATLGGNDAFPGDNRRFHALNRPADLRVQWIGEDNRFLRAALEAVTPVIYVLEGEPADLLVVVDDMAPPTESSVLLVHAQMPGVVEFGPVHVLGDAVQVITPESSLLADVDATNFTAQRIPIADPLGDALILAQMNGMPFLIEAGDAKQRILFIGPHLVESNLPITVDFPVLIANFIGSFSRTDAPFALGTAETGQPISLAGRGETQALYDPSGQPLPLSSGTLSFVPSVPGIYVHATDRGTFGLAANVPRSESRVIATAFATPERGVGERATTLVPMWPFLALLAAILLFAEVLVYTRVVGSRRRTS